MGEIPGFISPSLEEVLPPWRFRAQALTEAMKQMAGGLPEEVGHGDGPETSAQNHRPWSCVWFLDGFFYMVV